MKCLLFDLSIVKLTNNHFGDFSIYLYKIDTRITFDIISSLLINIPPTL